MGKTLLQQLYDGEIYPAETVVLQNPEHKELTRTISEETGYFKALLAPDDWSRFEKLDDMRHNKVSSYYYAYFNYGFRLGVSLLVEALANGDKFSLNDK